MPKNKTHTGAKKRFRVTGPARSCASRPASATCSSTSRAVATRRLDRRRRGLPRRRPEDQEAARQ